MKILVTGGAGFLGSNLCKKLLENEGNFVVCLDHLHSRKIDNIRELLHYDRFKTINGDITEKIDIEVDQIYNAACPSTPKSYGKDFLKTFDTCIIGTKNLLELAKKYNAKFLQFSTSEIYGTSSNCQKSVNACGNVNTMGE